MQGVKPLIDMRRNGERPSVVFIDTDRGAPVPEIFQWQNVAPRLCDVDISPSEALTRLDFRPLVGLTVSISGTDPRRVKAVAYKAMDAHAKRVIYTCLKEVGGHPDWPAFAEVFAYDTAGHFAPKEFEDTNAQLHA